MTTMQAELITANELLTFQDLNILPGFQRPVREIFDF